MLFLLGDGGDRPPELMIHRFCNFALKTINCDMGPVFEKFESVFDQELSDLQQRGESHEQYAAYQEYLCVLEQQLVQFLAQEGYGGGNANEFLAAIQQQAQEDAENVEKEFQKMWEAMSGQFGDGNLEDELLAQMREFYKPPTAYDLMQTVLRLTEYETFSSLMRSKVQKTKMIREMQRKRDELRYGELGLAHRFIEFAMKVLNQEMEPFYRKNLPLFNQGRRDLQQHGHTLEQYTAFQEFISLSEGHLLNFVAREGFGSDTQSFILELQRLSQLDRERLDAELKKTVAEVQRRAENRNNPSAAGEASTSQPMLLICQPTSIGELIDEFGRYAEYETFDSMMRDRASHMALIQQLFASEPDEPASGHEAQQSLPASQVPSAAIDGGYAHLPTPQVGDAGYAQQHVPPTTDAAGYAQQLPNGAMPAFEAGYPQALT